MKKSEKKLALNRETVRTLSSTSMNMVAAGKKDAEAAGCSSVFIHCTCPTICTFNCTDAR